MAFLRIILWTLLVAVIAADDSCPASDQISPCTCDGEGMNCMAAKSLDEIRKAFSTKFKYGGVRSVWVQGTPLTTIPKNLFGNVKSQQFYVEVNNVTSLDFNAFAGSKKTLRTLSLFGNKLTTLDYSVLEEFERLEILNLGRNEITSIPDGAFKSRSLYAIVFAQNKITHIGMNAFVGLTGLSKLEMSLNQITTLGPMSLAFKTHPESLQINLAANRITTVSNTAFQGTTPYGLYLSQNRLTSLPYDAFGNLITRIGQKGGFIEISSNPLSCTGCDYSWIVLNKDALHDRLVGFTCDDGRRISDLTKSGIQCPSF